MPSIVQSFGEHWISELTGGEVDCECELRLGLLLDDDDPECEGE
jgi:hypothetical protein